MFFRHGKGEARSNAQIAALFEHDPEQLAGLNVVGFVRDTAEYAVFFPPFHYREVIRGFTFELDGQAVTTRAGNR